ncbi:MAG: hypothetical protein JW827_09610 [Spirochaetes bacterium]|nr:hypothetical protein [Spirochaetota bacterium]
MTEQETYHKNNFYTVLVFFMAGLALFLFLFIWREASTPLEIIVAFNPPDGGKPARASKTDGDYYNEVTSVFTENIEKGSVYGNLSEYKLIATLYQKTANILNDTLTVSGWKSFEKILKKYSKKKKQFEKVAFESFITKPHPYRFYEQKGEKDVNRYFRLMDSPSENILKKYNNGILSHLFSMKPDIIINFDLGENYRLFSINMPSFKFFDYIRKKYIRSGQLNFSDLGKPYRSIAKNWRGDNEKEKINNLLHDMKLYFTGYSGNRFLGLGYNMIDWDFRDSSGWFKNFNDKEDNPHYQTDLKKWQAQGKFWERETMKVELKRRQGKRYPGGDNQYASAEIIKYIRNILNGKEISLQRSGPVFQYDEIDLYTTGIVINVHLGSLNNENIRSLLTTHSDALAEAICVSLYSLTMGYDLHPVKKNISDLPSGDPIDFKYFQKEKYCGKLSRKKL